MKKWLLLLIISFVVNLGFSQVKTMQAVAFKYYTTNTGQLLQSDWEKSNVIIKTDLKSEDGYVAVETTPIQFYALLAPITDFVKHPEYKAEIRYRVVDLEKDQGLLSIFLTYSGELYVKIDFSDCGWIYKIKYNGN